MTTNVLKILFFLFIRTNRYINVEKGGAKEKSVQIHVVKKE